MSSGERSLVDCVGCKGRRDRGIKRAFTLEALLGEQGCEPIPYKAAIKKGLPRLGRINYHGKTRNITVRTINQYYFSALLSLCDISRYTGPRSPQKIY
jgi:hypothetical protein